MKVIIVGAGIGGLMTALALHKVGIEARVFESVREIKPLGVGINVLPNAGRVLEALGLIEDMKLAGIQTKDVIYHNRHGQPFLREPRGTSAGYRVPQFCIHRGQTQMIMLRAVQERLGAGAVSMGHEFLDFEQQANGRVRAIFKDRNRGNVEVSETADLLIGADGIHSVVRRKLYPNEGEPIWNGQLAFRGATQTKKYLIGSTMIMAGNPKSVYFMSYPMSRPHLDRGEAWLNWAAVIPSPDPSKKYRTEDWNRIARLEDFLPHFEGWNFDWLDVPEMIRTAPEVYEFPFVDRDPLPRWSFGRVTLLGDAAHSMHPWGSSGATLAMVDAYVVADALSRHAEIEKALEHYESIQRTITTNVINENRKAGPLDFMAVVEERAPNGFTNIDDIISQQQLTELVMRYKPVAAFDLNTVNKPIEMQRRNPAWI